MLVKPSIAFILVIQTVDLARFIKFLSFVKNAGITLKYALNEHVFCFLYLLKTLC